MLVCKPFQSVITLYCFTQRRIAEDLKLYQVSWENLNCHRLELFVVHKSYLGVLGTFIKL